MPSAMGLCRFLTDTSRFRWSVSEVEGVRKLHLEWRECGGPPVSEPQHQGFGSTLLQRVLPMQCNAEVEVQYDQAGLAVSDGCALGRAAAGSSLLMACKIKNQMEPRSAFGTPSRP